MAETIAAISTAPGEGGIGIVRVSGEQSLPLMMKMMANLLEKKDSLVNAHVVYILKMK